jgi:nitrite reductase/ring-hydroxylating ferredoxin subunit
MHHKRFVRVCSLRDLSPGRRRLVELDEDRQIALFNVEGTIYAVSNICLHQHSPVLVDGMVEDCIVTCPMHGWQYELATGRSLENGASLRTFEVSIRNDEVWVEEPDEEMPRWARGDP